MTTTNETGDTPTVDVTTALGRAVTWLRAWLMQHGGSATAGAAMDAGRLAGHARRTIRRAGVELGVDIERRGFGAGTVWSLPPTDDDGDRRDHARRVEPEQRRTSTAPVVPAAAPVVAGTDPEPTATTVRVVSRRDIYGYPVEHVNSVDPAAASHWGMDGWHRVGSNGLDG